MRRSLTVIGLVSQSYRYFFRNLGLFARTATVPILVMSLGGALAGNSTVLTIILGILSSFVVTGYAMMWHGTVLARQSDYRWYLVLAYIPGAAPGTAHFFLSCLGLAVLAGLISGAAAAFSFLLNGSGPILVGLAIATLLVPIVTRLSLVLPARAIVRAHFRFPMRGPCRAGMRFPSSSGCC